LGSELWSCMTLDYGGNVVAGCSNDWYFLVLAWCSRRGLFAGHAGVACRCVLELVELVDIPHGYLAFLIVSRNEIYSAVK
jgi:hypothetical protein